MKLCELLNEDNIKNVKVKYLPNIGANTDKIGSGAEAEVYAGRDSGTIIKELWIKESTKTSATYQYIDMVMSHQDNPFFPRIYNAKLYTRHVGKGHSKLVIHMERLQTFNSAKTEHLLPQLLDQLGISADDVGGWPESAERIRNMKSGSHYTESIDAEAMRTKRKDDVGRHKMLADIGTALFNKFKTARGREELMKRSTNPQLKEAIKLTGNIILKGEEGNAQGSGRITKGDLHESNIMVRLTQHGPQLVIVDPVISRGV